MRTTKKTTGPIFAAAHHRSFCLSAAIAVAALCVVSPAAYAQKGKPSGNSQPPVTIVVDFDGFEYRPDLGGVYDTRRGIVWGYSFVGVTNSTTNQTYAKNVIPGIYAAVLEDQGDVALAQGKLEAAAAFYDAAAVAGAVGGWRLPTLAQARDAVSRGLFTYGASGLNMWTGSPADTTFGLPYGGRLTWSNDAKDKKNGWSFMPTNGSASAIGVGSAIDAILVRSYTGP